MGDETIELLPPLPDLAQRAVITFLAPKHGLLGRNRPAPRAEAADRAVLRIELGKWVEERELDLAEKRAADEAPHAEAAEPDATRAERSAAMQPTCGYCGVPRQYRGLHHLVVAGEPSQLGRVGTGRWRSESQPAHLYSCPRCGSPSSGRATATRRRSPGGGGRQVWPGSPRPAFAEDA